MRLAAAVVFAFFLTACQTVGIEEDPDRSTKLVLAAAGLMVDGVGVYGTLPVCGPGVGDICQKPKAYRDAKLLANATVQTFAALKSQKRSVVFLTAALAYSQYEIAKTLAAQPGPTDPEAAPTLKTKAWLDSAGLFDVLVTSADQRVQDAASPNTSVAELVDDLQKRAAALP